MQFAANQKGIAGRVNQKRIEALAERSHTANGSHATEYSIGT